jgi:cytochrome c-type biogenesis protein CcmE
MGLRHLFFVGQLVVVGGSLVAIVLCELNVQSFYFVVPSLLRTGTTRKKEKLPENSQNFSEVVRCCGQPRNARNR